MSDGRQRPHRVWVTGASRGIGRAVAERLLGDPDGPRDIIVSARGADALDELIEAWSGRLPEGRRVIAAPLDLTDRDAVREVAARLTADEAVDGLVLNAGLAESAPLHKTTDALFDRTLALNVGGVFAPMRAALPGMLAAGFGRIVAIASIAAHGGMAYCAAYCASKHAVLGLVRAAAREYAAKGITVNAVSPGYVDTPMTERSLAKIREATGRPEDEALGHILASNPQGRLFDPQEVAASVAFLLGPEAGGINGVSLRIDGGEMAG